MPYEIPAPMLAKSVPDVPDPAKVTGGLSYEPKWDGFRALISWDGENVEIGSRGAKPLTRYFPELVEATGAGILVEPHDPAALAAGLAELLLDAPRRAALGERGAVAVRERFGAARMARDVAGWLQAFTTSRVGEPPVLADERSRR